MAKEKKAPPAPLEYPKVKLKFKDMFVFKDLYLIMFQWLDDNEWRDKNTLSATKYMEEFYLEKTGPTGAKDQILYWEVEKIKNAYIKFSMSIKMSTLFLNKTEIMHKGKKVKTDVGELKIEIQPRMHTDYKGEWINHWLLGAFGEQLERSIHKAEIEKQKGKLYKEVYKFQAEIKRYLKLQQFMSSGTDFLPPREV